MINCISKEGEIAKEYFIVVTTIRIKCIEYRSSFHTIMILDLYSLKTFTFGFLDKDERRFILN